MRLTPGLRVGLYGRKSYRDDDGEEAASILVQFERGENWAQRNDLTVIEKWADNLSAWSGKERPNFLRALAALENGHIEVLWVYGSDRFTRQGARAILEIMDRPIRTRPRVFFDYESLCTWEDAHRIPLLVKAEVDRQYADKLSNDIRNTNANGRRIGRWVHRAPYGTRRSATHAGKLEPHPDTWSIIVRIYVERDAGYSLRAIAMRLNADRVPSPGGKGWANVTIRTILHNPVYEGWMITRVKSFPTLYLDPNGNPVRVFTDDAETLSPDLVTRARTQNHHGPVNTTGSRTPTSPMRGVLYCAGCGGRMQRSGGPNNRHYRCPMFGTGQPCNAPAVAQARSVEPVVARAWTAAVSQLDIADETDHAVLAAIGARWTSTTAPAEAQQQAREAAAHAKRHLARLRDDRDAGLWDDNPQEFAERVRDAQRRLADAESSAAPDVPLPSFAGLTPEELEPLIADDVPAGERNHLLTSVLDAVVIAAARYRGEPWRESRVVAVVPVSPAPRTVGE